MRGRGKKEKERLERCFFPLSHSLLVSFPNLHNINWFRASGRLRVKGQISREFSGQISLKNESSVAAVQSCFCFIIVAAAIVLGIGALFLLFVLLYSQRLASQSCETLGELLHHPKMIGKNRLISREFSMQILLESVG